ncbi:MAG: sensor histidine kinase [Nakamurella sp.]
MTAPATKRHRRWSLRARLIALVLVVAALALAAVDVLLPMRLQSSLVESRDSALRDAISAVNNKPPDPDVLKYLLSSSPLPGEIGFTQVFVDGSAKVVLQVASDPDANPQVATDLSTSSPVTVGDADRSGSAGYRALAIPLLNRATGKQSGFLVAWVPLADVNSTVGRLILTELLITAGLLLLLGATLSFLIRRELKPLEAMATAADDIAGGDLDRRVYPGDAGTEIGRLGFAFNGMLDGISQLIAEREQGEIRMRQFLADASHELRTPVAAVRGYTDLYKAGALPDDAAVDRAMERMGFEANRMGALVGDLLTLIQADAEGAEQYVPVDLTEILNGVVDDAAVIDRTRVWRLAGTEPRGSAMVFGDRLRLHQLFANLLANVRTHTDPGTTATVTLAITHSEVTVSVSDDGPGVRDADLPKLFDRFFRVDASRSRIKGGTGLGLSIVAAIVRSHRGRVLASHTPGGGLTTTVMLPLWMPNPAT